LVQIGASPFQEKRNKHLTPNKNINSNDRFQQTCIAGVVFNNFIA